MPTCPAHDGALLHHDVLGDGPGEPVVVLAGGPARHPCYLGDLAGLPTRRRLVVPHLRGVGRTPAPRRAEDGSFWHQAADVEALRSHLGLDRAVIAGHSAGARLALAYAARFPDRVAGLLLITPAAGSLVDEASDVEPLVDARRGEPAFDAALAALESGPAAHDGDFTSWQQRVAPAGYATWGHAERAHARVGRWSLAGATAYFSVPPPSDLAGHLRGIAAPALVVIGAQDCFTGVAGPTALAGIFPNGRAVVIERSGHYPWIEQPAAFRRAVDPFLAHGAT